MRYSIHHKTAYEYASDVLHAHHILHLVPRPAPFQQCLEHTISLEPATFRRHDELDAFGNVLTRIEFEHPHRRLEVVTQMEVDVHQRPKVFADHSIPWERLCADLAYHGAWPTRENLEACRFRHESPYVRVKQEFTDYAADCFPTGRPILACADALMVKLYRDLKYAPGETAVGTPLREVLKKRRGVCQDFAHLMIACLRSRGLAARYVSDICEPGRRAAPRRARRLRSDPALHTRGWQCTRHRSAGSTSILPTTFGWVRITSPSPGAAISATSHRCTA